MIITIDIPDAINRKLEAEKRKTGLSKSRLVRHILEAHYEQVRNARREVA